MKKHPDLLPPIIIHKHKVTWSQCNKQRAGVDQTKLWLRHWLLFSLSFHFTWHWQYGTISGWHKKGPDVTCSYFKILMWLIALEFRKTSCLHGRLCQPSTTVDCWAVTVNAAEQNISWIGTCSDLFSQQHRYWSNGRSAMDTRCALHDSSCVMNASQQHLSLSSRSIKWWQCTDHRHAS